MAKERCPVYRHKLPVPIVPQNAYPPTLLIKAACQTLFPQHSWLHSWDGRIYLGNGIDKEAQYYVTEKQLERWMKKIQIVERTKALLREFKESD